MNMNNMLASIDMRLYTVLWEREREREREGDGFAILNKKLASKSDGVGWDVPIFQYTKHKKGQQIHMALLVLLNPYVGLAS